MVRSNSWISHYPDGLLEEHYIRWDYPKPLPKEFSAYKRDEKSFFMKAHIDILLATYQGETFLESQLESILLQSYSNYHVLIRDDGSTDRTLSIIETFCQKYPDKIFHIPSSERLGAKGNFSELMRHSKAPYLMFCDQDDVWLSNKIEMSFKKMQSMEKEYGSQTPLLVHSDLTVVDQKLKVISNSFWEYSQLKPIAELNRLLAHNNITGCTVLINRPLANKVSSIPKEAIMHDWWLGLVASCFGKIDFLNKPTILYRQHHTNDIGAKNWNALSTYISFAKKGCSALGRKELHNRLSKTIAQASQFLQKYESCIDPQKQELIRNYIALGTENAFQKRYIFLRHRYFKNTLAKNIGMFLFL